MTFESYFGGQCKGIPTSEGRTYTFLQNVCDNLSRLHPDPCAGGGRLLAKGGMA